MDPPKSAAWLRLGEDEDGNDGDAQPCGHHAQTGGPVARGVDDVRSGQRRPGPELGLAGLDFADDPVLVGQVVHAHVRPGRQPVMLGDGDAQSRLDEDRLP